MMAVGLNALLSAATTKSFSHNRLPALLACLSLAAVLPASPVAAQEREQVPEVELPLCFLAKVTDEGEEFVIARPEETVEIGPADAASVIASCGGSGIVLGQAERLRFASNSELDAMLVEIERYGDLFVSLIRRDENGAITVEDLSGTLSIAAGRSHSRGLGGMTLDFTRFAEDGTIGLVGERPGRGQAARQAVRFEERFAVGEHVRQERTRRGFASPARSGEAQ